MVKSNPMIQNPLLTYWLKKQVPKQLEIVLVPEPENITNWRWKDKYGRRHAVKEMSTSYIHNCIRGFKEGRIPYGWHGGWLKWRDIFANELISRQ
jgi:hypothetical protein